MGTLGPYNFLTKLLALGLIIQGPKGWGKSFFLYWIFCLCCWLKWPLILIDPSGKGDLYKMCRDWAIANGFASRLVLFDFGDKEHLPKYNRCKFSDDPDLQARYSRGGIMAGYGNFKFGTFAQMYIHLYMCLYVAIEQRLSFLEAIKILEPNSALRHDLLPLIHNPFVKDWLTTYDALSAHDQHAISVSSTARLTGFMSSPVIQAMLTADDCYNIKQGVREKKIVLIGTAGFDDEMAMFLQLFINDLLADCMELHREGVIDKDHPILLIIDEFQTVATVQAATMFTRFRGVGLHSIVAHHDSFQLQYQDESGYLLHETRTNILSRAVFGGTNDPDELKLLVSMMFLDRLDPNKLLDLKIPHTISHEETRPSYSVQATKSATEGISRLRTVTDSTGGATSLTKTEAQTDADGESDSDFWGDNEGEGDNESKTVGLRTIPMMMGNEIIEMPVSHEMAGKGKTRSHNDGGSFSRSRIHADMRAQSQGIIASYQHSVANGIVPSSSTSKGLTLGTTVAPFLRPETLWLQTHPMSLEWQVVYWMRQLRDIPPGYFWIKTPGEAAVLVQCPYIQEPRVSKRQLNDSLARIWAAPLYFSLQVIDQLHVELPVALNGHQNGHARDPWA